LGVWNKKDCGLRPAHSNSLWDPDSKITRPKLTAGMAQVTECLPCKWEAMSLKSQSYKNKKEKHLLECY
jgi:hypothetical protein